MYPVYNPVSRMGAWHMSPRLVKAFAAVSRNLVQRYDIIVFEYIIVHRRIFHYLLLKDAVPYDSLLYFIYYSIVKYILVYSTRLCYIVLYLIVFWSVLAVHVIVCKFPYIKYCYTIIYSH